MVSTYNKPFLDVNGQLDKLSEAGMVLANREHAYRELQSIGYYRLSGYWYPFRKPTTEPDEPRPSDFIDGTTLDEVLSIYRFDEGLRLEMLRALSRIEVAVRFRIGHLLGRRGPFTHNESTELDPDWTKTKPQKRWGPNCIESCERHESDHGEWMRKQERNETIASEAFIAHFNSNYGKPLPVWTATEVMSLGDLNRLFGGMTQRDRQQVAVDFDIFQDDGNGDARALSSWLEHLRQTRNYCAHYARLWNRNHTAPYSVPESVKEMQHLKVEVQDDSENEPISRASSRIYSSLVLIAYLLVRIDHSNEVRDSILTFILKFTEEHPNRLQAMGFPENWQEESIWKSDYARDADLALRAEMLRDVSLLYQTDAAACLTVKTESHKARSSFLKYYRKKGAVLSIPGAAAYRYPAFQFNMQTEADAEKEAEADAGDLFSLAITANRRLLKGSSGTEDERWSALKWWNTPQESIPSGLSPRKALEARVLSLEMIDGLLEPRSDEKNGKGISDAEETQT